MIAINDGFYLESAVYSILRKYFRGKSCYVDLLDLFHEVCGFLRYTMEPFKGTQVTVFGEESF